MKWKILSAALLLVVSFSLLGQSSESSLPETGTDYWQEQREYYQQYPAWELPTEAIIEWLNQLEQAEINSMKAEDSLRTALNTFDELTGTFDQLQTQLEKQQSQLENTGLLITTGIALTLLMILIK